MATLSKFNSNLGYTVKIIRKYLAAGIITCVLLIAATSTAFALCGDVSGDGQILSNDVLMVARASIGTLTFISDQISRADVTISGTPDGRILSNDLLMIARASLGMVTLSCNEAVCGNGVTEVGEQCDDGNATSGDGCSATCQNDAKDTNAWITIPAGDFIMGCADANTECNDFDKPKHTVSLSAYKIQKYEVTNAQYKACVDATVCTAPSDSTSYSRSSYYSNAAYNNYPVIYVDWNMATTYCHWSGIGGRLPTEAEWEKAARGPSPREVYYPWGNNAPTCSLANAFIENLCVGDTSEVGSYPTAASYYGIMDMAGNVREWVNDWADDTYYTTGGPPWNDPQGPMVSPIGCKIARGGSWLENAPTMLQVSARFRDDRNILVYDYGFRCAHN